jgi:exosortase K
MKIKVGVLAVVALAAFGLKRHYADATTDALAWMLAPTAHLVALVTDVAFVAVPGEGYFSAERMFLIEKACAGVNFMIAAFAMVAFALLHRARSVHDGAAVVIVSLAASYVAAVLVNTIRIVIAMWLAAQPMFWTSLTAAEIHRLEGIAVYFGGLLLLYALVQWVDSGRPSFRYALPLGCYYAVTLGVPFVNGAQGGQAFLPHAAIVLLVPPLLIFLVCGAQWFFSRYPRRNVSAGSSPQARCAGNHAAAAAATANAPAPTR